MKSIVFKVDVDTYRGTREGATQLAMVFKKHNLPATFLFSLGPDHTGWALKRMFRPGFFKKVARTSVVEHYGIKTLLYGVLLPAPHIGQSCAQEMRAIRDAGFEVGIHSYDHVYWQDNVHSKSKEWTEQLLDLASAEFKRVFGTEAHTHGSAGWQMNEHAFKWMEKFKYASDLRGSFPFYPQIGGRKSNCLQMPTTLPTLDEILGVDGITAENIHLELLKWTAVEPKWGHVFTLHAELEGMKLLPAFENFIVGLKKQKYEFLDMKKYFQKIQSVAAQINGGEIAYKEFAGRSGLLYQQAL